MFGFALLKRNKKKIINMVRSLQQHNTEKDIQNYIDFIYNVNIPNFPEAWQTLRASYKLVYGLKHISPDMKNELKNALLSRGVNL